MAGEATPVPHRVTTLAQVLAEARAGTVRMVVMHVQVPQRDAEGRLTGEVVERVIEVPAEILLPRLDGGTP